MVGVTQVDVHALREEQLDHLEMPVERGLMEWPDLVAEVQLDPEVGEVVDGFQPVGSGRVREQDPVHLGQLIFQPGVLAEPFASGRQVAALLAVSPANAVWVAALGATGTAATGYLGWLDTNGTTPEQIRTITKDYAGRVQVARTDFWDKLGVLQKNLRAIDGLWETAQADAPVAFSKLRAEVDFVNRSPNPPEND